MERLRITNKQNANRYDYVGENEITYHSLNHNCDILSKWSGANYYFVKATICKNNCDYPSFPYRLSRYDKERLELRKD